MPSSKEFWWFCWFILFSLAFCDVAHPRKESAAGSVGPPLPAGDEECPCRVWDRISRDLADEAPLSGHCRRNSACTGTICSGKSEVREIGAFNHTFQLFPCLERPKIFLRVSLSIPKKGVDWTHDFYAASERVGIPGLSFFGDSDKRVTAWVQVNITKPKESAVDEVVLSVSMWGKISIPATNSTSSQTDYWKGPVTSVEHQHLPLPACRNGLPVPKPCRAKNYGSGGGSSDLSPLLSSSSLSSSSSPLPSTIEPYPVGSRCHLQSLVTRCDITEVCRQVSRASKDEGICECRLNYSRDADGKCVDGGGGGAGSNSTSTTPLPTDAPGMNTTATPVDPGSSSHGAAIGGTLGTLIILGLLAGGFWWWRRRRQTRLRIVRLYDDEEVLMRNDGYQPVSNQEDNNQII